MSLREEQTSPPITHLRKAVARVEALKRVDMDVADLARSRKTLPTFAIRIEYANILELVLRDYERILEGLLPEEFRNATQEHRGTS